MLAEVVLANTATVATVGNVSFSISTHFSLSVEPAVNDMPVTFPPETVPNGEMLSGLPLPNIRGTMGTFYYFATDLSRYEEGDTEFGGILKHLSFDGTTAKTELPDDRSATT